jgi:hypothetical protein
VLVRRLDNCNRESHSEEGGVNRGLPHFGEAARDTLPRRNTLSTQEFKRDPVEFVRIGYNDCSINWLAVFNKYEFAEALESIQSVDSCNNFSGKTVARALTTVLPLAYKVSFGREGSPVLYIELDLSKLQDNPEALALARDSSIASIKKAFARTQYDEFHTAQSFWDTTTIRFWWD